MLVGKFQQKLAGWKVGLLSHAGRMVLIKSVLCSVPVCYMSIEKLTTKTINQLEGLMRRFLWGKVGTERYMGMVAWHKICVGEDEGGLGIKSTKVFNQALIQKLVWQLANEQERVWVPILKAKYFPNGSIWSSEMTRNTSGLWKALQENKGDVLANLQWLVSDGNKIEIQGQTWYPNWNRNRPVQEGNRMLKVSELYNHQEKKWREEIITQVLGQEAFQSIQQSVPHPVQNPILKDRLIWMVSKKGVYSVKEGYKVLFAMGHILPVHSEAQKKAFQAIWKWKELIPKVRLFLWRALQNGLTTSQELSRRIRTMSPKCVRCNEENEYTMHLLFFCTVSRATWFASPIALRVEGLPLDFAEALLTITRNLEQKQIPIFCNTLWSLWKARNEELFTSKAAHPRDILARTRMMEVEVTKQPSLNQKNNPDPIRIPSRGRVIQVDGSWDTRNRAGIGMGVYNRRGDLVYTRYDKVDTRDPFHAEALAVLLAIKYAMEGGNEGPFLCVSDSKNLVRAIQEESIEGLPSWRAAEAVQECINWRRSQPGQIEIKHIGREARRTPHEMANWARITKKSDKGMPIQCGIGHLEIEHSLNMKYFEFQ